MPKKLTYEKVKSYIKSQGYQLLSTGYNGVHYKLTLLCPERHQFEITYNSFKYGRRCPICFDKKRGNYNRLKFEEVKFYIESQGYKLLSKNYKNNIRKLSIQCPYGHIYKASYGSFKSGRRCPVCAYNSQSSKAEKEIQEYVAGIYNGKIINNDRSTIMNPYTRYNLELDIYLPELNKAIEFNGKYWHDEEYQIKKDRIKKDQCKNKNIDLFIIQDKLYELDKEWCLSNIQNFIYDQYL